MWKAQAGHVTKFDANGGGEEDDDWETDPDYINEMSEHDQRFGAPDRGHVDLKQLREGVKTDDDRVKGEQGPKSSYGYGGKFGVEQDDGQIS